MVEHCHQARFVFNIALEQRAMWRRDKHDRGVHPERGVLDAAKVTVGLGTDEGSKLHWSRQSASRDTHGNIIVSDDHGHPTVAYCPI